MDESGNLQNTVEFSGILELSCPPANQEPLAKEPSNLPARSIELQSSVQMIHRVRPPSWLLCPRKVS